MAFNKADGSSTDVSERAARGPTPKSTAFPVPEPPSEVKKTTSAGTKAESAPADKVKKTTKARSKAS